MKYIYNRKSLPPLDLNILERLDRAASTLADKLQAIHADQLPVSGHFKDSVRSIQRDPAACLTKYFHLLAWSLHPQGASGKMAFIDYGAGHGLMACLAKQF
jgi:hypothetical protein